MDTKLVVVAIILLIAFIAVLTISIQGNGGVINLGKPSGCNYDGSCQGWEDRTCSDCAGGVTTTTPTNGETKPECNDKYDNDGDGWIDMDDSGCFKRQDNDETDCGDGVCEGPESCEFCPEDCGQCPTTTTIPWTCTDTDGGQVYTVKGTVSGQTTEPFSYTDYCGTGNATLFEHYCRQTGDPAPMSEYISCTLLGYTSCTNGACV